MPPSFGQKFKDGMAPLLLSVLQTALVAWFGLQITGKLDLAIKERQIALDSAKSMSVLVEKMQTTKSSQPEYKETALKLAMFGEEAIPPLILMSAAVGPYSEDIPLDTLKVLSALHIAKVCEGLRTAVSAKNAIDEARFQGILKTKKELGC